MRRLFVLAVLLGTLVARAEEGEWQFHLGGGGYFPLTLKADDRTVVVLASWQVAAASFFGFTDNFDLGLQYGVTYLADIYAKETFNGIVGKEYFNYLANRLTLLARYNIYPGYPVSPHLFAGGGMLIETFRERAFYTKSGLVVDDFDGPDYARVQPCLTAGFDVQYRVWEWLILSVQMGFSWSPRTMFLDTHFFVGATWFLKSYYLL